MRYPDGGGLTAAERARRERARRAAGARPGQPRYPHRPGSDWPGRRPGLADGLPAPGLRPRTQPGPGRAVSPETTVGRPRQARHRPAHRWPGPGSGACSTARASSKASSPEPGSTSRPS